MSHIEPYTFRDLTIVAGRVQSMREHDAAKLGQGAIAVCQEMLQECKAGAKFVPHKLTKADAGGPGLPPFGVSLERPAILSLTKNTEYPGRYFTVAEKEEIDPFQINIVVPSGEITERDRFLIGTILGISFGVGPGESQISSVYKSEAELQVAVNRILNMRPLMATAIVVTLPFPSVHTIKVAADFSTCFGAAMLLDLDLPADPAHKPQPNDDGY